MDLYEIFRNGSNIQGGSTERIAREMAMMQMQREAQENARAERLYAAAQRRMQAAAVNDPALVRMRSELERPVEPFSPERPGSYAPGTVGDVRTLRGAFDSRGEPAPYDEGPLSPGARIEFGDLQLTPAMEGAYSAPRAAPEKVYETTVRAERLRKPLPGKPRRMEGGIDPTKGKPLPQQERSDLSPEGAEMYQKLAPSLVARRNSEETSRRTLEGAQMNNDSRERTAQLRSATDLLRQQMRMQMEAERFRQRRMGAKGKDEALKWADQERDARLNAMNAAAGVVSKYKAAMADDPNDPEYRAALQALDEATRAYSESERDFNALRTERKMDPKNKGKGGAASSYMLDESGNLVPAQ